MDVQVDVLSCMLPFISRALSNAIAVRNGTWLMRAPGLYQPGGTTRIQEACKRSPGTTTNSPTIQQRDGEHAGAYLIGLAVESGRS